MRSAGNGKKPGMTQEQHLYSDAIYRINSVVESIIEAEPGFYSDNEIQLWAIQLDSTSRKFRWLLLRREDWTFNEAMLDAVAALDKNFWDSWNNEKESQWEALATSWPEADDQKKAHFGEIDGKPLPELWDEVIAETENGHTEHPHKTELLGGGTTTEGDVNVLHHAFMKLVEGRSFSADDSFEGTVLELVRKGKCKGMLLDRVHSTQGETEEDNGNIFRVYEELVSFYRGEEESFKKHGRLRKLSSKSPTRPWMVVLQGAIAREREIQHVINVPIYDGGQAGACYGRLVGIIHGIILKKCKKLERDQLGKKIGKAVRRHNDKLAAAFRAADMARIARESVTREDRAAEARGMSPALHHFLHVLPMVQDWKSVEILHRNEDGDWNAVQCWERAGRVWNKPEGGCAGFRGQGAMGSKLSILDMLRGQTTWLDEGEKSALEGYRLRFEYPDYALIPTNEQTKEVLERQYWQEQIDVWAIVLPKVLLRLRREREALRRAVSGIMGRNMSHNIGSHVLARYASEVRDDGVADRNKDDQRSDFLQYLQRRMDFLADVATSEKAFWFQSLSLKEQIGRLNWEVQKERFTKCREQPDQPEPVLLRFITGKEDLKATVNYKSEADVYFACPGGEVGVHALFVILENIIRNSARHGSPTEDADKAVELEVQLRKENQNHDLLKMKIVDPRSSVEQNREVTLMLAASVKDKTGVKVGYTKPTGSEAKPIQDRKGGPVESFCFPLNGGANARCADDSVLPVPVKVAVTDDNSLVLTFDKALDPDSTPAKEAFCVTAGDDSVAVSMVAIARRLDDRINDIMKEPILTSDGEAKAQNWGIREMQICAHYLRGFSLFDLESPPDEGCAVLAAGCHDGKLKYTIYLERAKRMAVVRKPDSKTNSPDEKQLERQGVKIIETADPDWRAIGTEIGSYEYLVVEKEEDDDSILFELPNGLRDATTASLPVRRLKLCGKEIEELVRNASKGGSQWMEPLHKRWANGIRNRRTAWRGKPLFGVSLLPTAEALNPPCSPDWPDKDKIGCDGLIFAQKSAKNQYQPLPADAEEWLQSLKCDAIAASWVDHGAMADFAAGSRAGLGQSSKPISRCVASPRLWISAETARSNDPHTRFLNDRSQGNEWEILAAAVPRIAVLDERVQSAGGQGSTVEELTLYDLWSHMGVWTPKKCESDLDRPDFDKCKEFLKKPAKRCDQYPVDFLVIHLTILERLAKDRGATLRDTLDCLVRDTHASDAEIVIVTGRGVPAVARAAGRDDGSGLAGVRYLPISALLESLVSRPSKLGLMRTLWSAGTPASSNI